MKGNRPYLIVKRGLDLLGALVLLVLMAIPMFFVAFFIKLEDGGPVIYKSKRVGKNLKEFDVYKFRSMRCDRKELTSGFSHEEAVTRVGKFIRKTSLDELPQLFNIIKGDMSFIGPRPWIPEYYKYFSKEQKKRCDVLPGITGLAQAMGRNNLDIFEKINYDIEYTKNVSFKMDCKVIIETVKTVLSKTGAEIKQEGIQDEINMLKAQ
jgi:lipopolysaccharide/colanic/teichoic acid biosynthesis glycosyltransferase